MNTAFALMACYQKPLIPLETVGADYLGLGKREVNEQAARNKLPFLAIRLTDSAKAPRFVRRPRQRIDQQAEQAQKSWQRSQL
ncbi:pyocin activator PrtN family protein [uncultured Deefgea sp.]|uniref:pyocin activator PrtN family protein n=1 Tax=uncultured Deefgea sp. TaxID=1304914 RepID=UPI00260E993E|nr:pyocin activator PrtN family protein [uncultured Deefgea sp.]